MTPPTILHCRGNIFTEFMPSKDRGIHRQTHASNISSIACVFVAAVMFLPNLCVATVGGIHMQTD
jgi:hypothetical protein